jgi:conjugative transfer region protein (TIGR03748 family)
MTRSLFHPLRPVAAVAICVAGLCTVISPHLYANDVQVGRYSLVAARPTAAQLDPLEATMMLQFPEGMQTVGDAVHYLLQSSGYRLASLEATHPEAAFLSGLPLPTVQRTLGPLTLRQALATLAGPAFRLVEDPVHRLVTFERCAMAWQTAEANKVGRPMAVRQTTATRLGSPRR